MIRVALMGSLLVAGCFFSETPESGALLCSSDGKCPTGYGCLAGACWKSGSAPAAAAVDRCDGTVPVRASSKSEFTLDTAAFKDDLRQLEACIGASEPGNDAFFAVDAQAGQRWHFHVKPGGAADDPAIYALTTCDDRTCVPSMAEDECGAGRDEHLSIVPATTGRLLVGIDSKLAGAAKFNVLALQPVCGDGTLDHSESCDDKNTDSGDGCDRTCRTELSAKSLVEQEPNDDTIGANVIVLGAATGALTVTGTLGGRCDYDTYAVTVPAKGSVNATLLDGTNACGGGAPSLRVALIAQDGQSLLGEVTSAAGGACPGFGAMQAFSQWLAAGTYSVRVTTAPNDAPTFGYKLRIEVGG